MKENNKGRRHELKMLHYQRRLRLHGLNKQSRLNLDKKCNLYAFRSHGHPCSCWCCSPQELKYNRAKQKDDQIKNRKYDG